MFRFCLFIPYGHVEEEEGVWLFTTWNCQRVDKTIERIICRKVNILEHNIRSPPGRWVVQSKSLSMRGRICGVRRFASSPPSSGMLNRVYHLVVHFQKLHCKENEEVIVGFYTKPPMGGTCPTIKFPKALINHMAMMPYIVQLCFQHWQSSFQWTVSPIDYCSIFVRTECYYVRILRSIDWSFNSRYISTCPK